MSKSSEFVPRIYRHWIRGTELASYTVTVKETDLYIRTVIGLRSKAEKLVLKYRASLEGYIEKHPEFLTSLVPVDVEKDAPRIVRAMAEVSSKIGVGPMAAVAGAIAEFVGEELAAYSPEVIIENGGDIYLKSLKDRVIGIYAGNSPLTGKVGLQIRAADTPVGICTSSGTVGHSLSFGKADAAITVAKSATFADAAATALGNIVRSENDIERGIEFAQSIPDLKGVVIIIGGKMGMWGNINICRMQVGE